MPPDGTATIAQGPEDLRAKVKAKLVEGKPTFFKLEAQLPQQGRTDRGVGAALLRKLCLQLEERWLSLDKLCLDLGAEIFGALSNGGGSVGRHWRSPASGLVRLGLRSACVKSLHN